MKLLFIGLLAVGGFYAFKGAASSLAERGYVDASWANDPASHVQSPVKVGDVTFVSPIVVAPERKAVFQ